MLTAPLKQTPEYKRLLAGMAGAKPAVVALFGMPPTARAQMLAALCEDTGRSALVVCAGEADATRFAEDAAVFGRRAEVFPARDYVLRPVEGQSHEYEYRRLAVLGNLVGGRTSVACAPVEAVLQYTTPKQEFCGNTLTVKQGMAISMDVLIERLFGAGYLRRFQVDGPGQFSVRGGIVDIYAPDMQKPHRLEFWGDEVDSIHSFDLVSQRREGAVKKFIFPRPGKCCSETPRPPQGCCARRFQGKARLCGSFGRRHGRRPQGAGRGYDARRHGQISGAAVRKAGDDL